MTEVAGPTAARAGRWPTGRAAVPWATVVPLAAVLAAADWFWVVSLRGAVGAIERTRDPFVSWVQGSVMLTPLFAFSVLAALALAHRWFGPVLRRPRYLIAAALLVVAAGTLAGLGTLMVSGAYDLRLQLEQLDHTVAMGVDCADGCLTARRDATIALQLKAVAVGGVILLVTNLLLVGWMVAIRGGRLDVGKEHPAGDVRPVAWFAEVQLVLVAALVGTGTVLAIHATADLLASAVAALLLLLLATAQLACAQLVTARPGRPAWLAAAALAVGPPVAWVLGHVAGAWPDPWPGQAGPIGLEEGAVAVLELATLSAAALMLLAPAWLRRSPGSPHAGKLGLVGIVAVTAIGVGGSGLAMFDLGGVDENPPPAQHHGTQR